MFYSFPVRRRSLQKDVSGSTSDNKEDDMCVVDNDLYSDNAPYGETALEHSSE